ncbi:uncharacterized protein CC84DRAFT_703558 [Paraphaeosphaeria sporulosa]|uniref:Uncharacterized protein n=1 Tax=Paraphaeosphaeria sporulosa TaxID=1460663 RepID=A0A177CLH9_9PLEO|nr:uncharacterized protein CC84DRAFT_703558 [Paraphaeosphaeria sporulosa]OAG07637.1 hypothetical protein CC84DRAFT_703558 [Paraphaeosphaeria sporulosa]
MVTKTSGRIAPGEDECRPSLLLGLNVEVLHNIVAELRLDEDAKALHNSYRTSNVQRDVAQPAHFNLFSIPKPDKFLLAKHSKHNSCPLKRTIEYTRAILQRYDVAASVEALAHLTRTNLSWTPKITLSFPRPITTSFRALHSRSQYDGAVGILQVMRLIKTVDLCFREHYTFWLKAHEVFVENMENALLKFQDFCRALRHVFCQTHNRPKVRRYVLLHDGRAGKTQGVIDYHSIPNLPYTLHMFRVF